MKLEPIYSIKAEEQHPFIRRIVHQRLDTDCHPRERSNFLEALSEVDSDESHPAHKTLKRAYDALENNDLGTAIKLFVEVSTSYWVDWAIDFAEAEDKKIADEHFAEKAAA
jgi:hypothetical protein